MNLTYFCYARIFLVQIDGPGPDWWQWQHHPQDLRERMQLIGHNRHVGEDGQPGLLLALQGVGAYAHLWALPWLWWSLFLPCTAQEPVTDSLTWVTQAFHRPGNEGFRNSFITRKGNRSSEVVYLQ